MNKTSRSALIISASSDIGSAIAQRWIASDWLVYGTYRTRSDALVELESRGGSFVACDVADPQSVEEACSALRSLCPSWDALIMCPGSLDPIGPFTSNKFEEWEHSIQVNFIGQMRVVQRLLPSRRASVHHTPSVLFFAGGGSNSAPTNYSAYTISKLALTKMCELLDAEIPDTRFVILGPGWVDTKIHEDTFRAGKKAGDQLARTQAMLQSGATVPMERVLDCVDWVVESPRLVVSGRNFSVANDRWGTTELHRYLLRDPDMYKLRRGGNDWTIPSTRGVD